MSLRKNWILTRQKLLRRAKSQVQFHSGEQSIEIQAYRKLYEKEFSGAWRPSNVDRLLEAVEKAELVLGGDFHAYSQSQRTHLRILRALPKSKRVILALECLFAGDQKIVDQFMAGQLSEDQFLLRIGWNKKWGFPWENYRPLFDLAKKRGYHVAALNKSGVRNTNQRELLAAKIVNQLKRKYPQHLIYVVYGDFHLSTSQLPKKVRLKNCRTLIIHQDSSKLYFKLARKRREEIVKVLEKSPNQFCVLTSPPWVKWQSYHFYLEGLGDSSLGDESDSIDWTEPVHSLFEIVSDDIDLRMKGDDFSVYLLDDPAVMKILKNNMPKKYLSLSRWMKSNGRSFFVPVGGLFLISHPSVNHAAGLFGDYIQSRLTARSRLLWDMPQDFAPLIWIESLGFFMSKLINHRRKPEQIQSLMVSSSPESREVLFLILEQNMDFLRWAQGQERRPRRFKPSRRTSYLSAARLLGGLLGERMYALFRSGKIDSKRVLGWLSKNVEDDDFDCFFKDVVGLLKFVPKWAENQDHRL